MKTIASYSLRRPAAAYRSIMKRLVLTLLTLAFIFPATSFARDEKTALEEFKKDIAALKAWSKEREQAFAENPLGPMAGMAEMTAKFKAVNTEGLPADLKEGWASNLAALEKMAAVVAQMPADPEEVKKKMADPEFQKDFGGKMRVIQQEMAPASKKMQELAQKYGFESLGKKGR
jgi:hypothetical protein